MTLLDEDAAASAKPQRAFEWSFDGALRMGKMLAGRQILFTVDKHIKVSEIGNSVCEAERFFSVKLSETS